MTYIDTQIKNSVFVRIFLFFTFVAMQAQDVQFTQFYASNLFTNPAFAGSTHMGRLISHSRYQWPNLEAKYYTTLASFDFFSNKYNSGFGVYGFQDYQGKKNISSSELALMYTYELAINEKYTLRWGLQGSYVSRYINYSLLNFPDQFSNDGPLDKSTQEPFGGDRLSYKDINTGLVLYDKRFWASLAVSHLNRPNQSFYGKESRLPIKYLLATGYKLKLRTKTVLNKFSYNEYIVPSINYKFQGKSDQLDIGVYYLRGQLIGGAWFRGLPLVKQYDSHTLNTESFAVLLGLKLNDFSVSYSYDFVVSKLTNARPFGAHELNIVYLFPFPKKNKKVRRVLPCPDFQR